MDQGGGAQESRREGTAHPVADGAADDAPDADASGEWTQKPGEVAWGEHPDGYWYPEHDSAIDLLAALRTYEAAHGDMRRRTSAGMDMNMTDLDALRHVIAHERHEEPLTPLGLARLLRISGASSSKLLDRLTASGHLQRVPNPDDRRSSVVVATDHGHTQVRERLDGLHARMQEAAEQVPEEVRGEVAAFLRRIAAVLDAESTSDAPLPSVERSSPAPAPRRR
ncbi:MarR family winged helix-turn-helix transcriptional regulator [Brachybacterium sp. GU-2]|uniref:MarR family winged helix-turn-helix transcriptional regulator n=1 Tax=Brachybacterium sp. GU-2 TaxID=3069708 RepID=UPI00280A50FD|nr:MarR family transcriptional regulator [Brachybacterium sp. GU-2]WME24459.1 MarR family transcriptional regulator [Brachybacterium sp. GU-2]